MTADNGVMWEEKGTAVTASHAGKKPDPPGKAPNPHSLLLTPEEAMSELRCSRATLFKLLKDNEIDSFLLAPNARRIPRTEVEAYMKRKLAEHDDVSDRGAA